MTQSTALADADEAFRHWMMLQSKMPYRSPEEIAGMGWHAALAWAAAREALAQEGQTDPVRELLMKHATLIEEGNDYAYFELAYTRQTGWMAWLTDRPARGEPGTAEYAKSRNVIARGQGNSPDEACADALSVLASAPQPPKDQT